MKVLLSLVMGVIVLTNTSEDGAGLFSSVTQAIMDILKSLHANNGLSIVMVTHDLDLAGSSDRIVRMQDGEVVS